MAPLGSLAQFAAIGPENRVPSRHRSSGMYAYAVFFGLCNVACAYYATDFVTRALRSCFLQFDCALESLPHDEIGMGDLVGAASRRR